MAVSPGLAMQVWMSILCAVMHSGHREKTEAWVFAWAQTIFLIAGALEAGRTETESKGRIQIVVILRLASVVALVAYWVVSLSNA